MRSRLLISGLLVFSLAGLVSCSSGKSPTKAATSSTSSTTSTTAAAGGEGGGSSTTPSTQEQTTAAPATTAAASEAHWPGAVGCTKPSADAIGTAYGATITQTITVEDGGCIWQVAPSHAVQVSYHPTGSPGFGPEVLNTFHSSPGVTDISVPGSSQAFLRPITLPNMTQTIAYIVFPEGTVMIVFVVPNGQPTHSQMEAVIAQIVG